MHSIHFVAAALAVGLGLFFFHGAGTPVPPAGGHDVLIVTGDRDGLAVTGANHKAEPWAGARRGMLSEWSLSIRDGAGRELAAVPLDMSAFALDAGRKGTGVTVEGCIVRDSRVAMLVNAPTFPTAASYVFLRGDTAVGTTAAATVRTLAGGGR
ncbi:MAG: hypothetical protein U1E73_04625 [Planctomycetota bacterium]